MSGRKRGTVVVLSAIALTLVLLDLRGGSTMSGVRSAGANVMAPMQTVAGAIAAPAVGWIEGTSAFSDVDERAKMWAEQAPQATEVRNEQRVAELDALLGQVNNSKLTVVPARVVAYPLSTLSVSSVVVDVGSDDGVDVDQAVVTGAGLVGRTTAMTMGTADVKLLSSPDSAVGGRFLRTGQACVVVGTGDPNQLTVRVLDPVADVQVGDAVLSFGSKDGRPFPADLPIGLVSEIEDDGTGGRLIRLKPAANLAGLDLVGVVNLNATRELRQQLSAEVPVSEVPPEIPVDQGGGVG